MFSFVAYERAQLGLAHPVTGKKKNMTSNPVSHSTFCDEVGAELSCTLYAALWAINTESGGSFGINSL
jgi:hypothetical protein